jgi:CHASE3 domain sensor protein
MTDYKRILSFLIPLLIVILVGLATCIIAIDNISRNEDENIRYKQVIKQAEDLNRGRPSEGD